MYVIGKGQRAIPRSLSFTHYKVAIAFQTNGAPMLLAVAAIDTWSVSLDDIASSRTLNHKIVADRTLNLDLLPS